MSRSKPVVLVIIAGLAIWVAVDLWGPRRSSLRDFDPKAVARLETDMWRSYYDRRPARLFFQMGELMRTQYRFPLLRSQSAAYDAAKAAFIFKDGHNRGEYERALPNLNSYYRRIRAASDTPFDEREAARLELEWWIVHRERRTYGLEGLERALAGLESCLYKLPADRFRDHAKARAEAMLLRDDLAERGGVTEADWARIGEMLERSWMSLWETVRTGAG